jgi:hypothetical protein
VSIYIKRSIGNGHIENNSPVDVKKIVMTVHQEQGTSGNRYCPMKNNRAEFRA